MKAKDDRLSVKPYWQVLERVQTQFDLMRFSLKVLKEKDQKQFCRETAEKKIAQIDKFRTAVKQQKLASDEEADRIAGLQIKIVQLDLRRENRAGNIYATSEFTEDRLNQSELLLLVAHFESFMKELHTQVLKSKPRLMAVRSPGRTWTLEGDIP